MRQKHFYLTLLFILTEAFLLSGQANAQMYMGTEKLGEITLTRGQTKTIDASYRIDQIYSWVTVTNDLGWYSDQDAGFYPHSYQNDRRSKFSVTGYATCYQQKLSMTIYYTQSDGQRCYKIFYYLVTVNNDSYTKVERDIELAVAGTLSWRINSSDKNSITHLTLHGDINGSDLKFLREMAGYNDNQGNLRYIDLRDVHFVAGGGDYVTIYDYTPSVYEGFDLPDGAFYWCRKLTEIWLPEKLGSIGTYAFEHCDFLTTVHIPEGAHTVYGAAFDVCYNLKELSIPSTIKTFYPKFQSSYKFKTLYCYAVEPPTRGTYAGFDNCTELYVPQGCKQNYLVKEGWGSIANIYETLPKPKLVLTATPAGGQVNKGKVVKLKATASDAEIYYTTDGTPPSKSSTKYENGVSIDRPLTLKAIAYHDKFKDSDVLTEEYTVKFSKYDIFTATTVEGIEVKYNIADDEGKTCKVYQYAIDQNTTGKVTIPEEVYGMHVVEIDRYAFYNRKQITSVSLPNSVKRINIWAFMGCSSLSSITGLSNVEYIGSSAFSETPWLSGLDDGFIYLGKVLYSYKGTMPANTEVYIKEGTLSITPGALSSSNMVAVSIPKSLKELDGTPFGYGNGLKTIVVASGNTEYDSRGNCNALIETATNKLIAGCSGTVIPNTVKVIERNAFNGNAPEELVIPNSVDSIAQSSIRGKALKKITVGTGLRKIDVQAIQGTSVTSISVASGNPYLDSRNNCNAIIEKSTNTLLVGCPTTVIPNTVKVIANNAFYTNSNGFNGGKITIPESVEKIEQYAFQNCNIGSVVIGSHVNEIQKEAFWECNSLVAIYPLSKNPAEINEDAFSSYSSDKDKIYNSATLVVPVGSRVNYRSTAGWNKFSKVIEGDVNTMVEGMTITKEPLVYKILSAEMKTCSLSGTTGPVTGPVNIPSQVDGYKVTTVVYYVLSNHEITTLSIPATVVIIYGNPFYGNKNLTSITVDEGNPKYDSRNGCNAIIETASNKLIAGCTNTIIPNGVKHIGFHAFGNMSTITKIAIPGSVTVIDSLAFFGSGLTEITIPASVQEINYRAFFNSKDLSVVTTKIKQPFAIGDEVFSYIGEDNQIHFTNAKLLVPKGTKARYMATDGWKNFQDIEEIETEPDPSVKGDVNEDKAINGTDLVALTNIILGKSAEKPSADVNGDGQVNGTDYVALANIILGKANARQMTADDTAKAGTATLHIEPFDIKPGETQEMAVSLSNPDDALTLLQFDLQLPQGLTVEKDADGLVADMAGRTSRNSHQLCIFGDGSKGRFLLASADNELIDAAEGSVIRMRVTADAGFSGGTITLRNILGVSPDEQEVAMPDWQYAIAGGTDGIYSISDAQEGAIVYSLSGQRLHSVQKGINIINGKKVIKK